MLFVFLDFDLNIGTSTIGLIPDFVGYMFMLAGLRELANRGERFVRLQPFATGMIAFTGVLYAMDLLGITASLGAAVAFVLGLASTLLSLYISYGIVMGVRDMERQTGAFLNAERLLMVWRVYAVLSLIIYILLFLPMLAIFCIVAGLVAGIVFLVSFHNTKKLYERIG
jgi:hypothetical protein